MWGLDLAGYLTEAPLGYWSGRAIFKSDPRPTRIVVDIPPDRQGMVGETSEEDAKDLQKWLNKKGLKALRKKLADDYITGSSEVTVHINEAPFYLYASPRASYGHLYISAWKEVVPCDSVTQSEPSTPRPPA